ncbi:MAG: hypothetical protein VX498_10935 [Myxococcota bacterium]|nr:hypothetical protein [Myxococcota bacterium]
MPGRSELEVEAAVVRDREFLCRAVFRPPGVLILGGDSSATIPVSEPSLSSPLRLMEFRAGVPTLLFRSGLALEVEADGEKLSATALVVRGLARDEGGIASMAFFDGMRAVCRIGELQVLMKARPQPAVSVWDLEADETAVCGGCGAAIKWLISLEGVLVPCSGCGDLNRFAASLEPQEPAPPGSEEEDLSSAMEKDPGELPSQDAISVFKKERGLRTEVAVAQMGQSFGQPAGPAAFDDEEPTDLIQPTATEPGSSGTEIREERLEIPELTDEDDEAPTDPGRPLGDVLAEPVESLSNPDDIAPPESAPILPNLPTGEAFFRPRRRRAKRKPNLVGWALVLFGLLAGCAGLGLLALSALQLSQGS